MDLKIKNNKGVIYMSLTNDEIKLSVLVECIRQHSNRRITNRVIRICEKYIDNVVVDWKDNDGYWISGIDYTDDDGNIKKCAIVSEDKFDKMVNEIFNK